MILNSIKYGGVILFLVFLSSCKEQTKGNLIRLEDFPKRHSLEINKIIKNEAIGVTAVYTTNDYFLLLKRKSDYFFEVYSKKDTLKKVELCYRGQGPMDFIAPLYSAQFKDNAFFVFDRAKSVFSKINIDKSILENKIAIDTMINFSSVLNVQARDMFVTEVGKYLYSEDFEDCTYYLIDENKQNRTEIGNNYKLELSADKHHLSQKLSTYNNNRFASVYFSFPKIDFASVESKKVYKSIHFQGEIVIKDEKLEEYLQNTSFDAIDSTDEYVYCLYNDSRKEQDNSMILVFDWEANPVCIFHLPKYYTHFSVDKQGKYMYLINWETEEIAVFTTDEAIN